MPGVEDVKEPFSTLPFFTVIHQHGNKSDRPKQHKVPLGRTWKSIIRQYHRFIWE